MLQARLGDFQVCKSAVATNAHVTSPTGLISMNLLQIAVTNCCRLTVKLGKNCLCLPQICLEAFILVHAFAAAVFAARALAQPIPAKQAIKHSHALPCSGPAILLFQIVVFISNDFLK